MQSYVILTTGGMCSQLNRECACVLRKVWGHVSKPEPTSAWCLEILTCGSPARDAILVSMMSWLLISSSTGTGEFSFGAGPRAVGSVMTASLPNSWSMCLAMANCLVRETAACTGAVHYLHSVM